VLHDVMKALTTRKPIAMTTTSLCSGAFAARIARTQRLHILRIAVNATPVWERIGKRVNAGLFKSYGVDVQTTIVANAAAALTAVREDAADLAFVDTAMVIRECAAGADLQFVALIGEADDAFVALAPAIDARAYAMARFARALREHQFADYVDARDLQARFDRAAAEESIDRPFPAAAHISRVAMLSGTR
jgi:hypothetical protein